MRNLNLENLALFQEVQKNEMRNNLLFNKSFPAIFEELGLNVDICHLTDAELAVSDVTLERMGIADALHGLMWQCRNAYLGYAKIKTTPAWLVESGNDDSHFETFFAHLSEIESVPELVSILALFHAMPIDEARTKYEAYKTLRASEKRVKQRCKKLSWRMM